MFLEDLGFVITTLTQREASEEACRSARNPGCPIPCLGDSGTCRIPQCPVTGSSAYDHTLGRSP